MTSLLAAQASADNFPSSVPEACNELQGVGYGAELTLLILIELGHVHAAVLALELADEVNLAVLLQNPTVVGAAALDSRPVAAAQIWRIVRDGLAVIHFLGIGSDGRVALVVLT
jgi:hypothetical protein